MLKHLTIKNYALIRHLELDFDMGFTVITGETGAGKSILLGALDLILGKRADSKMLPDPSKKCVVEGSFLIKDYQLSSLFQSLDLDYEDHTLIRREINAQGKSRAFVNDTPVSLNVLLELGERLVDIHSQHQNLFLSDSGFQLSVLDNYAGISDDMQRYHAEYQEFVKISRHLDQLIEAEAKSRAELDYYQFLSEELEQVRLKEGEQEALEEDLKILEHAEDIRSALFQAGEGLESERGGVLRELSDIYTALNRISTFNPSLDEISKRFDSIRIELKDLLREIERFGEQVNVDPLRAGEISDRLNLIYSLQQKHRVNSISGLLEILSEINQKLDGIQDLGGQIKKTTDRINSLKSSLLGLAEQISVKRINVIPAIEKEIKLSVQKLGMPDADFKVIHEILENPGKTGMDQIDFFFNANRGGALKPISSVASGGEKSRLMLAVKSLVSKKALLPTIIFDEIDTGVSGAVADRVGGILYSLSTAMQVIAITHLPQIAGKGMHHFQVYKEVVDEHTVTHIRKLSPEERLLEIAKLLSGQKVTSASVESARQLLNN